MLDDGMLNARVILSSAFWPVVRRGIGAARNRADTADSRELSRGLPCAFAMGRTAVGYNSTSIVLQMGVATRR